MHKINLDDAKTQLPDLIKEVIGGDEVVITKDDEPVVKIVPVTQIQPQPKFGSAKGLINMTDDFDDFLEDFRDYIE